jgi:outer membrane murein-binding lipoprotein Lpp
MSKAVLCFAAVLLAGCASADRQQTSQDANQLGRDLKRDVKQADVVVTQEMKDARTRVQEETAKAKRELDKPKQ